VLKKKRADKKKGKITQDEQPVRKATTTVCFPIHFLFFNCFFCFVFGMISIFLPVTSPSMIDLDVNAVGVPNLPEEDEHPLRKGPGQRSL